MLLIWYGKMVYVVDMVYVGWYGMVYGEMIYGVDMVLVGTGMWQYGIGTIGVRLRVTSVKWCTKLKEWSWSWEH